MASKNIEDLRELLFDAIEGVKCGKLEVERALMIGDLSQVMVSSAKVEVDYAKASGQKGSAFLERTEELPPGITGVHVHRMR